MAGTENRVGISVVATLYKSAPYIPEFCKRSLDAAGELNPSCELVLVNDGSPDDSLQIALELAHEDRRITVIDLSRNFGHHKAIITGLSHARGDFIFLIDSDLEEAPELLIEFWQALHAESNIDVVFGVQAKRKGALFERVTGSIYYALVNALSEYPIPANLLTVRLMTKRYVDALLQFKETDVVFSGIAALAGFVQKPIAVAKGHRGETSYNLARKISIVVNHLTSYSAMPLVWIFYAGCICLLLSFTQILFIVYLKVAYNAGIVGWASVIASIWFFGGLVLFALGILGIYIAKIYSQVKNRPFTIVRSKYNGSDVSQSHGEAELPKNKVLER